MTTPTPREELAAFALAGYASMVGYDQEKLDPELRERVGRLVDALEEAAGSAVEQRYLRQPVFRGCLFPTCLRQFDSMAMFSGEQPDRPEWSGKGWHQVRGSAVHSAGGHVCPDHHDLLRAHFPQRTEPAFPGQIGARCSCGGWAVSGLRWHGAARGMWEEHLLDQIGAFTS